MSAPNAPGSDQKTSDTSTSAAPTLEDELLNLPIAEKTPGGPNSEASSSSGKEKVGAHAVGVEEVAQSGESEELIVDWDGPSDPQNPKNWSFKRKWAATAIVSAFTFISPVSSSMIAPAFAQVASEFGITSPIVVALTTSIFVLAYAFGPLFLGPLSEIYGRSHVLQLANMWYLAWNIGCGFAQNTSQLIVFRFLAGLGGSAPLSIGGGVLGDCWKPEERGKAVTLYSLAPLLGPVIGPVAGAWIAEKSTWRWVFWSTSIADAVIQVLGLFYLQETFAPVLLERKAARIRKGMQQDPENDMRMRTIRTRFDTADRNWQQIFYKALTRPFMLWVCEPIVQLLGLYMSFVYGLLYLFLTTIPGIFQGVYGERVGIAGLHYFALGVGLALASQANAYSMDKIYKYYTKKNGGKGKPEYRLPSLIPGTLCMPVGLFIAGWTAEKHVHWIAVDIGIVFVGASVILNFQCVATYIIDAFTLHAASALAAVTFLRSCAGFGFPLFAPKMYESLGYGKGNTVLACIGIVIGCPAPFLFWKYGERIRKASHYARDGKGA